jgi:hypothetical protein
LSLNSSFGDRAFPRDQRRIEKEAPMKKALYGFPQLPIARKYIECI